MATDPDIAMILADMQGEFLSDTLEKIEEINDLINDIDDRNGRYDDNMLSIRRLIHSIKGNAGSFGFFTVSKIAHALEDFIDAVRSHDTIASSSLRFFVEAIADIVQRSAEPDEATSLSILQSLPISSQPGDTPKLGAKGNALVVMEPSVQRKIINRELNGFHVRVFNIDRPIDTFDIALTMRPELVITNLVHERMTGLEMANAFLSFERTRNAKVVILTAGDIPHSGRGLPSNAMFVHKGMTYARDMVKAIQWAGLA